MVKSWDMLKDGDDLQECRQRLELATRFGEAPFANKRNVAGALMRLTEGFVDVSL